MPPMRRACSASRHPPVGPGRGWGGAGLSVALLVAFAAGCSGPPPRGGHGAALYRANPHPAANRLEAISTADLSRGIRAAPWVADDPSVMVVPKPLPDPEVDRPDWVRLADWARLVRSAAPVRLGAVADSWEVVGHTGRLQVFAGTRQARFDGMDLWLGHAPRSSPEGILVHRVDLEKNLGPVTAPHRLPPSGTRRILLDPGHGGQSSGAVSVLDQRPEKEFALDWALRLAPLLSAGGWEVFLTRTNDVDLTIAERVAMADAVRPDLFLSLHFNSAAPDLTRSGVETYCLTPAGLPSTLTRNYDDNPFVVLPNNAHDEANLQYAARLHRAMLQGTGAVDRGIRRARFMAVLLAQNCPAVLLEGGFLSHPREAARIATPAYRQRLAECVAASLCHEIPHRGARANDRAAAP